MPSLSKAIRRIVEIGIASSKKIDQRAAKKASKVIDTMAADLKAGLKAKGK